MILGIDIGGSHITAALIDESPLAIAAGTTVRYRVQSQGPADEILTVWSNTIQEIWATSKIAPTRIGIAMPGPFDYEQGIALMIGTDKYEALYQMEVRTPLAEKLSIDPSWIRFRNDAEAFLLGEMMGGAGIGYHTALGITLGTGLGSTIHRNGITTDANRFNRPFNDSIAEDYISTRFFTRRYQQLTGTVAKDARELAERITTDPAAAQVYQEFSENLSLFLKDFIRDEQPQVIIIGGNIAQAWAIIYPHLTNYLAEELKTIAIKKAVLGEDAALIGGACCWIKPSM